MKEYILTGHKIVLEESWTDVTALQDDPTIDKKPESVRLERICNTDLDLPQAICDYLKAVGDEHVC
jgi:hypothetical protein